MHFGDHFEWLSVILWVAWMVESSRNLCWDRPVPHDSHSALFCLSWTFTSSTFQFFHIPWNHIILCQLRCDIPLQVLWIWFPESSTQYCLICIPSTVCESTHELMDAQKHVLPGLSWIILPTSICSNLPMNQPTTMIKSCHVQRGVLRWS